MTPKQTRRIAGLLLGLLLMGGVAGYLALSAGPPPPPQVALPPAPPEASAAEVRRFCGACHAYPPPDSLPRHAWRHKVKEAYDIFRDSTLFVDYPSLEAVALYYEARAPEHLPPIVEGPPAASRWQRRGLRPDAASFPAVTHVRLAPLTDPRKPDLLVCDAELNEVRVLKPYEDSPRWRTIGRVTAPAHAEVVDLDGDGRKDILVAGLGEFLPTDARVGRVVWLRGQAGGEFTPVTLLEGVGRVADVRAADFTGDGKPDLIVAVFGWQNTGEVLLLENQTTDWSRPKFVPRVLDERHGAIHVPVADLNGDGRPDFVALISQEHEMVVAFLNEGGGRFQQETVYTAPHPTYGSSGIQLVDLDRDGDLDVLYSNGDGMDPPPLLKPYHGIAWLENRGRFPFRHHRLADMYGVQRAVAADADGDGDLDVFAVSFLPPEHYPERDKIEPAAVLLLEQTAPGRFARHVLERGTCDHFTCEAGDLRGDGSVSLVVGNFCMSRPPEPLDAVGIWSPRRDKPAP